MHLNRQEAKDLCSSRPALREDSNCPVGTKMVGFKSDSHRIEIRIADNGNGIPQNIFDKVFQPFFTTRPTGSGLSLAYDIVKAHGGGIRMHTKESEGSEFIV